jgi:hypothetical protein
MNITFFVVIIIVIIIAHDVQLRNSRLQTKKEILISELFNG